VRERTRIVGVLTVADVLDALLSRPTDPAPASPRSPRAAQDRLRGFSAALQERPSRPVHAWGTRHDRVTGHHRPARWRRPAGRCPRRGPTGGPSRRSRSERALFQRSHGCAPPGAARHARRAPDRDQHHAAGSPCAPRCLGAVAAGRGHAQGHRRRGGGARAPRPSRHAHRCGLRAAGVRPLRGTRPARPQRARHARHRARQVAHGAPAEQPRRAVPPHRPDRRGRATAAARDAAGGHTTIRNRERPRRGVRKRQRPAAVPAPTPPPLLVHHRRRAGARTHPRPWARPAACRRARPGRRSGTARRRTGSEHHHPAAAAPRRSGAGPGGESRRRSAAGRPARCRPAAAAGRHVDRA